MTHGSLFSGIGGFDLAAQWMGWDNLFHCEINDFCKKVLKHYWPEAISYDDIKTTDFTIWRGRIDVLSGGFPCQPYSTAGKRRGKEDERHLWPEMLRAIREIQPRWVVGENVRGLTNWNGGMVFDEVQADLEAEGYEILPFLLPACAVNAPHRRDRIWFIAHSNHYGFNGSKDRQSVGEGNDGKQAREVVTSKFAGHTISNKLIPHSHNTGFQTQGAEQQTAGIEQYGELVGVNSDTISKRVQKNKSTIVQNKNWNDKKQTQYGSQFTSWFTATNELPNWNHFPTQSPVCTGNDGIPAGLDGITFSKWRNESIKAAGNAVVPQLVYQLFKTIEQYEQQN